MAIIQLEGVDNVRDLGGIQTATGTLKSGLLYRGGHLCNMTDAGVQTFTQDMGVSLVIDLRVGWERAAKLDVEIAGVQNVHNPFYDNQIVGIEYTKPLEGTIVIGNDFACSPADFYADMANPLTAAQIGKAVRMALESAVAGKPVYYHCSGGKDRAGILTLCILTVLGASDQVILDDYLLTNIARKDSYERVYRRFLRLANGNEEFARQITAQHDALPENLENFRASVMRRYGSMEAFIVDVLGIDEDFQAEVQKSLIQ